MFPLILILLLNVVSFTRVIILGDKIILSKFYNFMTFQLEFKIVCLELFHFLSPSFRVYDPSFIWAFILLDLLLLSVVQDEVVSLLVLC